MNKIKKLLHLFTLNGFKDDSKAYIIGFISFYFSVIFTIGSLIFSIYAYYVPYSLSKDSIVEKLNNLEVSKQWGKLNKEVKKLKHDNNNKDIYYLFKGRIAARITQVPKVNPDFYFSRVDPESPYYREVLHSRITYYLINFNGDERKEKFSNLVNQMEKDEMNYDHYYFFVKLLSLENYNYQSVLQLYKGYSNLYNEYNIEELNFNIHTTEIGEIDVDNKRATEVQSLYLIFLTELLYLGQSENITLPSEWDLVKEQLIQRSSFVTNEIKLLLNFSNSSDSFKELQLNLHQIITQ